MIVDAEILILPFASYNNRSLVEILVRELNDGAWSDFHAAVGFAKASGSFPVLLDALRQFAERDDDHHIVLTFGADIFKPQTRGSDFAAVRGILEALDGLDNVAVNLYHEDNRTFHPKLYMFSNPKNALVIIGSSNWSRGGLADNIEANVLLRLDLSAEDHKQTFAQLTDLFKQHWTENEEQDA